MKKTAICSLLGIDYPIIQGGMGFIASGRLAGAVSAAGGLGIISPTGDMREAGSTVGNLRKQIRIAKGITNRPFGVNISLELIEYAREEITAALEEGVRVFTVGAGSPSVMTRFIKDGGGRVFHVVASVKHARKAEAEGVDGVIASGYEAGGLLSPFELTTMCIIPQVVDAVKIPVVAAGGVGDGRGLAACMVLGAAGVQIGTLFASAEECPSHIGYKNMLLVAEDTSTVVTGRGKGGARVLKSPFADKVLSMEARGESAEEIMSFIGRGRGRQGVLEGDLENGSLWAGQVSGMIKKVRPVAEIMKDLVFGCDKALKAGSTDSI